MSRSKPVRRLFCSRCKAKHFLAAVCGSPKHFNVQVIGRTEGGSAVCRCDTCGHRYTTNSERGRRMASKLPLRHCQAGQDGECCHKLCPQVRDGEPAKTGRFCPLPSTGLVALREQGQ